MPRRGAADGRFFSAGNWRATQYVTRRSVWQPLVELLIRLIDPLFWEQVAPAPINNNNNT